MKRFIRDIIISISLIIIIAEITARFFELKSQYTDLISKDYEGFYSLSQIQRETLFLEKCQ